MVRRRRARLGPARRSGDGDGDGDGEAVWDMGVTSERERRGKNGAATGSKRAESRAGSIRNGGRRVRRGQQAPRTGRAQSSKR